MSGFQQGILKRYTPVVSVFQRLLDPLVPATVYYLLIAYRNSVWTTSDTIATAMILLVVNVVFGRFGLYYSWRGSSFYSEFRRLLSAWMLSICLLIPSAYYAKITRLLQPEVFFPLMILTPALLLLAHLLVRLVLKYFRSRGKNLRQVIIAGAGDLGQKVLHEIQKEAGYGMRITGFFDDRWKEGLRQVEGIPVLGVLDDIPEFVQRTNAEIIYIAMPFRAEQRTRDLVDQLQDTAASVYLVPDIFIFDLLHARLLDLGGIPIFSIFDSPFIGIEAWIKMTEDIVLGSIIILLILPVLIVIALLIKVTSKGPVIFVQRRYGYNGEEIRVYKFRSMAVCEDGNEVPQAKRNDPRITKLGAFLRRTSLDELPQFFNVLRGDMSIVGPRPHPVSLNEYYRKRIKRYMLRHKVKPGITGLAQVHGWRGETDTLEKMEKRILYDLEYISRWSPSLDIKIILLTILRGFRSENAY